MALLLRANLVLLLAFSANWMQRSTAQSSNCINDEVRLVGGGAPSEGRVEICVDQQWGTVCGHSWDNSDARVVCKQLGYPTAATAYTDGYRFGYGSGPIHLGDIDCSYLADRLISCTHDNDTSDCSHSIDAGVHCHAAPGAPQDITTGNIESRSLILSWKPLTATQTYGISIQQYNIECSTEGYSPAISSTPSSSKHVSGLHPDTMYSCCVSAINAAEDEGTRGCTNVTTSEAIPTAAPQNVGGYETGATSLYLYWSPPPSRHRNGRIRYYYIYVDEVDTHTQTQHSSADLQVTINSLHPHYTYDCRVAAYTIGEGQLSSPLFTITTDEAIPTAAPQDVTGYASDSTSISLSWSPPPPPDQNGRIRKYHIYVHEVETGTQTRHTSTDRQTVIHSLHPYYTYECKVAAYTVSEGPQHQLPVIKTLQDIPSAPPENITTTEVSTIYVYLNWIPPPTEHHNGIIIGYVVRVTKTNAQESHTLTSNTTELSVDSLTSDSEYSFAVAAQTVMGIGPFSAAITQQTKPTRNSTGSVLAGVAVFLAILISAVLIFGYIGYKKLRNKKLGRDITAEPKTARAEGSVHFRPQHVQTGLQSKQCTKPGLQSKRNPKGKKAPTIALQNISFSLDQDTHKSLQQMSASHLDTAENETMDETDPTPKLQSLTFCVNENMRAFLEKNEAPPPEKEPPVALRNISFSLDQHTHKSLQQMAASHEDYNPKSEDLDPTPKLRWLTFPVNEHVHASLEQPANAENLDNADASLDEDEPPPPIPERLYLEQDDTHCESNEYVAQSLGEVMRQGVRVLPITTDQQMNGLGSKHIYQPLLSRQRRPEYEITQSCAKGQDQSQQMNAPASDQIYQPLLPRRLYIAPQQENTSYQSLRVIK